LAAALSPSEDSVYRIFVKAISGESDYVITITERD